MARRALGALTAAVLAAAAFACAAVAHEDPASDYLVDHSAFLPYEASFSPALKQEFLALVTRTNRAGYRIRVAVVSRPADLGEVPRFWLRPRAWAPFLAGELHGYYDGRLLVVMPNGVGVANARVAASYRTLRGVTVGSRPDDLLRAGEAAVERLAAADGVRVTPPSRVTTPSERNHRDRVLIVVVALVALAVWLLVRFALQRRRATQAV